MFRFDGASWVEEARLIAPDAAVGDEVGNPAAYAARFPDCDPLLGDMNGDGRLNGGDIDPFFECLGGGVCP